MGLSCLLPRGVFYAFPSVRETGLNSREFAHGLLQSEQVACVPEEAFGVSGEGYLRCCYATGFEQLEEAVERMKRYVGTLCN